MKFNMKLLFSPIFTGVLFIVFAASMAVATFIENDFGAASARQLIYESKWFELIFALMVVNLTGQIFSLRLYRKKKITVLLFHLAFIVMIAGAAITRYSGFEGTIHIREGESSSTVRSLDKYMGINIYNSEGDILFNSSEKVEVTPTSLGRFYRDTKVGGEKYSVRYSRYIPNAAETVADVPGQEPIISFLLTFGNILREEVVLRPGELKELPFMRIGFMEDDSLILQIAIRNDTFMINPSGDMTEMSMMTRDENPLTAGEWHPFAPMMIYKINEYRIIPQKLSLSGKVIPVMAEGENATGRDAFELEVTRQGEMKKLYVYDILDGTRTNSEVTFGDKRVEIFYGSQEIELAFELKLEDFLLERYPGSSSPSGYKSNVVLKDPGNNIEMPYSIYMNNILKHRGYRFYQSSYDRDELGTILSVNHDMAGMLVTYAGYMLLFVFILLSLVNPDSLFRKTNPSFWENSSKKLLVTLALLIMIPLASFGNPVKIVYDKKKADEFGKALVQDQKGRTKPLYTVSNDILRKISRKNSYANYSPMQVFLGFTTDIENWKDEPIIKISNRDLRNLLGVTGEYASISQLVNFENNSYALYGNIEEVYAKPEAGRSKLDKEILKVDERVNIIMMLARGDFLKMFPLRDGTDNWGLPDQALRHALHANDSLYLSNILTLYTNALFEAKTGGDYKTSDQYLDSIIEYQRKFASYELPSESKVNAEIFYYKSLIFERLFPSYALAGVIFIIVLLYLIIRGKSNSNAITRALAALILIGFLFHTLGLGIRWYISGHSPMSNGYESLLFISWVTVLAGLLFSRKSYLTLAATAVLASLTLMVAHLSFMDPEITNLAPVLQSYWLTLHVSVITASYGFLGLGAILGLVVLILYSMVTNNNRRHILKTIDDLTVINYRSLELGLYFLTVGTFLGAVWANESWGRYWGWDPKETWSLITVIVYAFVVHSKMIKGLNSMFAFNAMSLFAFGSVLMTYFGVNYYLSGLHSYAGGDPVPVPAFVYLTAAALIAITLVSYYRYGKLAGIAERSDKKKGR
ncbi:MAG TPA: c-type cytochrome biogenesis protein CcsB [Bacteroidales bacterium]|nr:c-type cytochrome biogenesis protein CcsB [Bacteroidales bacterium]